MNADDIVSLIKYYQARLSHVVQASVPHKALPSVDTIVELAAFLKPFNQIIVSMMASVDEKLPPYDFKGKTPMTILEFLYLLRAVEFLAATMLTSGPEPEVPEHWVDFLSHLSFKVSAPLVKFQKKPRK